MRKKILVVVSLMISSLVMFSCSQTVDSNNDSTGNSSADVETSQLFLDNAKPVVYALNSHASGVMAKVNNISNVTVVSNDYNVLKAEYEAGFVQGHLQGNTIASARDNAWVSDNFGSSPPSEELATADSILNENFNYFIGYLKKNSDPVAVNGLKRLLFRMLGIYHGATHEHPANLDFSGKFLPDSSYFKPSELKNNYGTSSLSFMDVYFVNASMDFWDVLYSQPAATSSLSLNSLKSLSSLKATSTRKFPRAGVRKNMNPLRCTAFLKRSNGDVILTHNTWGWFLSQSMVLTINVNGNMVSMNMYGPGQIGSATDYGFNNKGIMFNETTNSYEYTETKTDGIFIFWRAALAEELSGSLSDFFHFISLDNTGSYMNSYMLVDSNTGEIGLVDMSYRSFVFFRSRGGSYTVTTLPAGQSTDYDTEMVTPQYILGYNYPASLLVRSELQCAPIDWTDRVAQLKQMVPGVHDVNSAKDLITYVDSTVRDSILARFDLAIEPHLEDYGTAPFGAIDAKVATTGMVRDFKRLSGKIDVNSDERGFWMRYGTAHYLSKPFIWSESEFSSWPHPDVPDALDGTFTYLKLYLR